MHGQGRADGAGRRGETRRSLSTFPSVCAGDTTRWLPKGFVRLAGGKGRTGMHLGNKRYIRIQYNINPTLRYPQTYRLIGTAYSAWCTQGTSTAGGTHVISPCEIENTPEQTWIDWLVQCSLPTSYRFSFGRPFQCFINHVSLKFCFWGPISSIFHSSDNEINFSVNSPPKKVQQKIFYSHALVAVACDVRNSHDRPAVLWGLNVGSPRTWR